MRIPLILNFKSEGIHSSTSSVALLLAPLALVFVLTVCLRCKAKMTSDANSHASRVTAIEYQVNVS